MDLDSLEEHGAFVRVTSWEQSAKSAKNCHGDVAIPLSEQFLADSPDTFELRQHLGGVNDDCLQPTLGQRRSQVLGSTTDPDPPVVGAEKLAPRSVG